jgi:transcriptional regulator with XRE-family HTH domain
MPRPRNIIGPQLRKLRYAADLSQPELAARCQRLGWDVARDAIAKIEAQTRWVPDAELLLLARVLSVEVSALYPPRAERLALAVLDTFVA